MMTIVSKLFGTIGLNKITASIVLLLLTTTTASAYMLKKSYQTNGEQSATIEQLQASSNKWKDSYNELNAKLELREIEREKLSGDLADLKTKLSEITDATNCLDTDTNDAFRMLFLESTLDRRMPFAAKNFTLTDTRT